MNSEVIIRLVVGPLMIAGIYALTTTLTGLPFEWTTLIVAIVAYVLYSYFRHIRK